MSYIPIFLKTDSVEILVIGGGKVATRKVKSLLQFSKNITIISNKIDTQLENIIKTYNLNYKNRFYKVGDIAAFNIVVVAVDDINLQKNIYDESKNYQNCLVNSVDDTVYCDFIFPAFIKDGDLTIAISTSGSSPVFAKYLKEYIKDNLPHNISIFLEELKLYRTTLPKGKKRMEYLTKKVKEFFLM